jgi:hypothetical protein
VTGDTSIRPAADQQTEVDLLRMMAAAPSLAEQRAIGARLAAFRAERAGAVRDARALDWSAQAVEQLYPTAMAGPGVRTTAASDWLGEVDEPEQVDLGEVTQDMVAAAGLWYRRVPEAVRADAEEFTVQAEGMARREASRHGDHAPTALRAFLDHIGHLHGRRVANDVPKLPSQFPPGSSLPTAADSPQTFDESMWGPAGPPDPGTAQGPPSLAEGPPPEGDQPQQIENPAAFEPHDAGPGAGVRPSVDYLNGTQTPPGWGSGLTTMTSLVAGRARQVLADAAGPAVQALPSSAQDQLTPSQQEGPPPQGDVSATGAPPVELAPHDAGPGNGPAVDEWDGQQYPFGSTGPAAPATASRRPLSAVAASIRPDALPPPAWPFLAALAHLGDVSENFGAVSGRSIVAALLRTAGNTLPAPVLAELRGHLAPRVAGDLPPWLKGKGGDKKDDSDSDDDKDEDDKKDSDDEDDDSDKDSEKDEDDKKDKKDDDCDDDEQKKTSNLTRGPNYDASQQGSHYYNEGYRHAREGAEYKGYGASHKAVAYGAGYRHGMWDTGKDWGDDKGRVRTSARDATAAFQARVQAGLRGQR